MNKAVEQVSEAKSPFFQEDIYHPRFSLNGSPKKKCEIFEMPKKSPEIEYEAPELLDTLEAREEIKLMATTKEMLEPIDILEAREEVKLMGASLIKTIVVCGQNEIVINGMSFRDFLTFSYVHNDEPHLVNEPFTGKHLSIHDESITGNKLIDSAYQNSGFNQILPPRIMRKHKRTYQQRISCCAKKPMHKNRRQGESIRKFDYPDAE